MTSPSTPTPNAQLQLLQANERTVLAWIRTGLAIMAFGFVVARIGLWLHIQHAAPATGGWSSGIGIAVMTLGLATHVIAAQRYWVARRAILSNESVLAGPTTILLVVFSLVMLGGALIAALLTSSL